MAWTHNTSPILTVWLILLVPFTILDASYVFLRPHSLPGGKWHNPWFSSFDSYAAIDLMYGRKNWESGDGFVAAHDVLHLTECALAAVYLWIVFVYGHSISPTGLTRRVSGKAASAAVIVGLMEGAMTVEMTLMCTFYEILGGNGNLNRSMIPTLIFTTGWRNLGHNSWITILSSWGFISSLYFFFSVYQTFWCAGDIYRALNILHSVHVNEKSA